MPHRRDRLARIIDQATGRGPADLVVSDVRLLNTATGRLEGPMDIAITEDVVVGTHNRFDGLKRVEGRGRIAAPGFIDTHLHIESSMVTPAEFEKAVLPRGTTTAICDPHEIANVIGLDGIRYFIEAARSLVMSLKVNLSSCVPATELETSGARLEADDLMALADEPEVIGLAELMNFPGVVHKDPGILKKLAAFKGRHIDGHAPLLSGPELDAYIAVGVSTEHECTRLEEAREKLAKGMHILLREGSIAKNVATLAPIIDDVTWMRTGFCTDDRNPLEIASEGHIDHALRLAIANGAPAIPAYRAATLGAATAFGLADRGMIAPGRRADILLIDDLEAVAVSDVVANGRLVEPGLFAHRDHPEPVGFGSLKLEPVAAEALTLETVGEVPVIGALPFSLITEHRSLDPKTQDDVMRLAVVERHGLSGHIGRGFVQGFGRLEGAMASSVAHDSHNLIAVGATAADMAVAINRLIALQGGVAIVRDGEILAELALPVAGLMTEENLDHVSGRLAALREVAGGLGCTLSEPLLQLAFLALPVIPHLKLTDKGYVAATPEGLRLL